MSENYWNNWRKATMNRLSFYFEAAASGCALLGAVLFGFTNAGMTSTCRDLWLCASFFTVIGFSFRVCAKVMSKDDTIQEEKEIMEKTGC